MTGGYNKRTMTRQFTRRMKTHACEDGFHIAIKQGRNDN